MGLEVAFELVITLGVSDPLLSFDHRFDIFENSYHLAVTFVDLLQLLLALVVIKGPTNDLCTIHCCTFFSFREYLLLLLLLLLSDSNFILRLVTIHYYL